MHSKTLRMTIRPSFGDVSREMFLEAVNSEDIFERMHKQWIQQCRSEGKKCLRPPSAAAYRKAAGVFRGNLRLQVDKWIDTGRDADGMETPATRRVDVPPEDLIVGEPALEHTLLHAFRLWESDLYGSMYLGQHGGLELDFAPYTLLAVAAPERGLFEVAKKEAARFFVWFFASDWRHNIVKCRKCGLYYVIKNPERLYKRGTYCRNHSATKSAEVITARKRTEKHKLLLRLAAHAYQYLKARGVQDDHFLKEAIVDRVNKGMPADMKSTSPKSPISIKWLTRNFR
jgi:hypothetical protein